LSYIYYADRVKIINDGSSDRQLKLLLIQELRVVHTKNKGKGIASKTSFEAAEGADIYI
jgi:hypothetical protein